MLSKSRTYPGTFREEIPSRKPTLSEAGTQQKLSSSGIPHFCNPFLQSTFWNNINFRYQHPFLSFFQKSACWPSCRRFAHYRMCRKKWNMMKHVTSLITCLRHSSSPSRCLRRWPADQPRLSALVTVSQKLCSLWLVTLHLSLAKKIFDIPPCLQRRHTKIDSWPIEWGNLPYEEFFEKACNMDGVHNFLYNACYEHRRIPTQQNES